MTLPEVAFVSPHGGGSYLQFLSYQTVGKSLEDIAIIYGVEGSIQDISSLIHVQVAM